MLATIVQTNALIYAAAAAGLLGMICQLILSRRYGQLIREVSNVSVEKKDFMKQLQFRFRTNRKRSADTMNISVFVKRVLMDYRFFHLRFQQWKRLAAGLVLVGIAILASGIAYGYRFELPVQQMQNMVWTMFGVATVNLLVYLWNDTSYKANYLQIRLEDYLCHSGIAADHKEIEIEEAAAASTETEIEKKNKVPAIIGLHRKKEQYPETRAQREKRELKTNLAKIKEGMKETAVVSQQEKERNREILRQMDSKEQERIIRDVLAEFLA
ncbi:MAG: hypothetical protein ACOX8M_03295 [Marvinbryantia sp.]|jgi:hypothetical protein